MEANSAVLERRKKELSKITSIINNSLCAFKAVIKELGWSEDSIISKSSESEEIVTCPLDPGHRMPKKSLEKHLETCSWIKKGYTKEEKEKALPSSHFFYKNSTSVVPVLIDKETQFNIISEAVRKGEIDLGGATLSPKEVPLTVDRCMTELTPQERFAIYDYVVSRAKATKKSSSFSLEELQMNFEEKPLEGEQKKSRIEILAEMRDYKRRRQSYRAKNVHITRKSYTEILREVIQNQVDYLQHMRGIEKEPKKSEPERSERKRSRSLTPAEKSHGSFKKREDDTNEKQHRRTDRDRRDKRSEHSKKRKRRSKDKSDPSASSGTDEKSEECDHEVSDHDSRRKKHKKHKKRKHKKRRDHSEDD